MSEDKTKDIAEKYKTAPTIETILERLDSFRTEVNIRLDRIESEVKQTHSEFYELRADFRELRAVLKETIPAIR
jgi:tetrahydromethanopterin S-methyltransferase subunit G